MGISEKKGAMGEGRWRGGGGGLLLPLCFLLTAWHQRMLKLFM